MFFLELFHSKQDIFILLERFQRYNNINNNNNNNNNNNSIPCHYSSLRARTFQPTVDLTFTSLQTQLNDHSASLAETSSQHAIVGFLDRDYPNKSVAYQIPHDVELTQSHTFVENFFFIGDRTNTASHSTSSSSTR